MLDDGDASHCWAPLHPRSFQVRGPSYLSDGKKMPSSQGSLLLAVEFFRAASAVQDVAGRADSPAHTLQQRCASRLSLVFVVNLSIPAASGVYQVVFYFGLLAEESPSAAGRLLERFVSGSDAFRSARLKLIPSIAEGPWLVRQGVGSRPAILGKTLRQRFHRGEGYFEVAIDCNSSPAAGRIVSLVKS